MSGHGDSLARDFRAVVGGAQLTRPLDRKHGGDVAHWADAAGMQADDILDFSASINPLGPPPSGRKAFINSYREIPRYPDPYGKKLKEALAARRGRQAGEVLVGNGSTELIYLICRALQPRNALIVPPAFSEYGNALTLTGAGIRDLSLRAEENFQFSMERLTAAWEQDCDIIFLATPNSVTGQLIAKKKIEEIVKTALARKSFLVVDEAFIDFTEAASVAGLVRDNPYVIVLRSLTKYYSLPGLRIGYLIAAAGTVTRLAAYQEPWSVNTPALNVALACLEDVDFTSRTDRWLQTERAFLSEKLAAIDGLKPLPSRANFLLVKIAKPGGDALQIRSFLLNKKILIRVCDSFLGLGREYFRVAVRSRKENRRLIAALAEWRGVDRREAFTQ